MRILRAAEQVAYFRTGADTSLENYLAQAHRNLKATSRTAQGVVDTSASPDKAQNMSGIGGQEAADLATQNFTNAISHGYANRNRQFNSPDDVRQFVEGLAGKVNQGILHDDASLLRTHDSPKYPYTRTQDLPGAMQHFYQGLHQRLNDPNADPVETAAYAEYGVDPGHHLFADGCGKTSKALSSYILMRHGLPLPTYPGGRDEYYKHVGRTEPIGARPYDNDDTYHDFLNYYRSMMPSGQRSSGRSKVELPPDDYEEYNPKEHGTFDDYMHHHVRDLARDIDIGLYDRE